MTSYSTQNVCEGRLPQSKLENSVCFGDKGLPAKIIFLEMSVTYFKIAVKNCASSYSSLPFSPFAEL